MSSVSLIAAFSFLISPSFSFLCGTGSGEQRFRGRCWGLGERLVASPGPRSPPPPPMQAVQIQEETSQASEGRQSAL